MQLEGPLDSRVLRERGCYCNRGSTQVLVCMRDTFCEKFTCLPNDNSNSFLLSVFYVLCAVQNALHIVLLNSHNRPKRDLPMGQEVRERLDSLPRLCGGGTNFGTQIKGNPGNKV